MDVHHHPELPHGKKKHLKEYFLEFLIIFLAVFMGFIAENIRERLSDSQKEHEYIEGLVKNFESDTAKLNFIIKANKKQVSGLDSTRKVTKDNLAQLPVQDSLFLLTRKYLFYTMDFKNNDVTLSQLRNAGGYRMIKNQGVVDSLAVFESSIKNMTEQYAATYTLFEKARDRALQTLDMTIGRKFIKAPTSTPVLITANKENAAAFFNSCWMAEVALSGYNDMLEGHLTYTKRLIAYLKKEYSIE